MGKITEALKKVTNERVKQIQKKPEFEYVVRTVKDTAIDEHVVSFHDQASIIGEQYKMLRTNIQSLRYTKNYKSYVVTSAIDGEGKTLTSLNLAITMAHDLNGKSILLIDADMRKGKLAKYLGIKQHVGLSDLLQGEANAESVFLNPGIDNLTVILSGKKPKKTSELLSSKKMEQLIAMCKTKFDYIFIDTPPVMPLTDACILGPMVDGVMLVVQAGRTQRDAVKEAQARLYQARAKTIGYIMTNVEYHLPQYLQRYLYKYEGYSYYQEALDKGTEILEGAK